MIHNNLSIKTQYFQAKTLTRFTHTTNSSSLHLLQRTVLSGPSPHDSSRNIYIHEVRSALCTPDLRKRFTGVAPVQCTSNFNSSLEPRCVFRSKSKYAYSPSGCNRHDIFHSTDELK
ncbi:hypothetical protein KC19_7G106200 [Ceratodon purpureus]|uniref:Uncharacterized protein n=1 Tax=Ceratodon purpureus TaxID=3225 RepID=A0A8T0H9L8_CERPU|nr:hypothetical protein KC19_7G106200 [Ceratodon purpureus]